MPVPRFYVENDLRPSLRGTLDAGQTRQVRSVLRLAVGSEIALFNGTGVEATARVAGLGQSVVTFEVERLDYPDRNPPLKLTVGLALLRGDRFDLAVQKLTEIGVVRIVPLAAERCVVSFDDARTRDKRLERYRRIAREAAEQSERVTLPDISVPATIEEFLGGGPVIVMSERSDGIAVITLEIPEAMAIAVGPEGGWTERERELIARHAASTASLGKLILRAETAAIVAAGTLVQRSWERGEV